MSKLMERFHDTTKAYLAPSFVGALQQIAKLNGLEEDTVWEQWQAYSKASELADQSAILWEFCQIRGWKQANVAA